MRINTKTAPATRYTHGGGVAANINTHQSLRRSVMTCMLWEKEFYEDGVEIASRIEDLISKSSPEYVAELAIEARTKMNLRHAPLWMCRCLAKNGTLKAETLRDVIRRADEIAEFLALYWKDGKCPISKQVKKGLGMAFRKFDEYQLGKYNRDRDIKLRDVLFLSHAKPENSAQASLWKKLAENKLTTPDTWEVRLSSGENKKDVFEDLLSRKKLGYMALLRNLRNMIEAGVSESLISTAISERRGAHVVLPFRFVTAAKIAPRFESQLDSAMISTLSEKPKLPGKTVIVVDVSGSMGASLSAKSNSTRLTGAATLAALLREVCEDVQVYVTGGNDGTRVHKTELIPARHGMALISEIEKSVSRMGGGGIFLTPVCRYLASVEKNVDRMIMITDEQDCTHGNGVDAPAHAVPLGKEHNYLINVASARNGIGYGKWTHIDGWSEAVVDYIYANEGVSSQHEIVSNKSNFVTFISSFLRNQNEQYEDDVE